MTVSSMILVGVILRFILLFNSKMDYPINAAEFEEDVNLPGSAATVAQPKNLSKTFDDAHEEPDDEHVYPDSDDDNPLCQSVESLPLFLVPPSPLKGLKKQVGGWIYLVNDQHSPIDIWDLKAKF